LDEGVPSAVGVVLGNAGHKVISLNKGDHIPRGSKDLMVCAFAVMNDAILVAMDGDMKTIAKRHGATNSIYAKLNLLKLSCSEVEAAERVRSALTLIEHEWHVNASATGRRIFIEIMSKVIRTNR
jgi:predicted nuclease of predicted toxin-antitoxin system